MTTDDRTPVALVTGAGGSLGRATALRLSADGFTVAVLGRAGGELAETARLIEAAGGAQQTLQVDLRDASAIVAAIDDVEQTVGPIAALVNNAAIYPATPLFDITVEEFDDVVTVNQRGYFVAAQAAARGMVARRAGSIVNVGSITWHGGWSKLASYVSTKGAAVAMTRAFARELGEFDVRVNAVSPGAFPTKAEEIHDNPDEYTNFVLEHQALKRRGTPDELANVIAFLVGDQSTFVTGQTINVDGGWVME
ncbi:SDR family NAD(P)-dependent oxidoreductase [Subtercola sp. YIM 133946]|uniref:SDR family NAD(P)-dependent oxidoreductase n=1 Tax=Subtercola sp. YIM 133946 TaxID=3118909 RepID=UPI002F943426